MELKIIFYIHYSYPNTSVLESYNHLMGIYAPKAFNLGREDYKHREEACAIAFDTTQNEQMLMNKILTTQKSTPSLIAKVQELL